MSTVPGQGPGAPETEALLQRVASMISGARALPLSSSVKLDNKDEVIELLGEAIERLPDELRQARWMLKEREEFLAATKRQADELVEAARSEAQRLVQRTEIAKEAQAQARRTVEDARDEARRMRLEAEDYADQKLAQFEIVLERTLKTVSSGRQKLSGLPEREGDLVAGPAAGPTPGASPAGAPSAGGRAGTGGRAGPGGRVGGPIAGPTPANGVGAGDKRRHGRHAAQRGPVGPELGAQPADLPDRPEEAIFDQDLFS